ncbi:polysaccharide deacetylase family protein [Ramlibacter sp. G-1-2-2]|uniref:Polysaccharide deacetylase family protein n=1 Tax=Ramlibacter agri TaxID=2728837 RepID=A0A848HE21_9BURK|nr:polysaccharide deacetylase family protein [Ramlibacter agri]NML48734.1 polysaccharide deacetylase family protein [Ramlibacter agri]
MDHSLYPYSALPSRAAPATLAEGLSACAVVCLEHWEALQPEGAVRDPRFVGEFGSFTPDYRSWTQREYGLRIGVFRVLQALREAGLRPAIAANARAVERLPQLVAELNAWGCEWIGHGLSANVMMNSRMTRAEQQAHIVQALDTLEAHTGQRPTGWLSQDWGTTPETFELLAEAGVRYTLDWSNDDQPYRMTPPLVALPLSAEWDDVQCQWLRNLTPRAHADVALQAFDRLRAECGQHHRGAVFGLALHPWVSGMSSRIGPLRELLLALRSRPDVRWAAPGEIAAAIE